MLKSKVRVIGVRVSKDQTPYHPCMQNSQQLINKSVRISDAGCHSRPTKPKWVLVLIRTVPRICV